MRDVPNSFIIEGVGDESDYEGLLLHLGDTHPFIIIKVSRHFNLINLIIRYQNVRGFRGWLMGLWYRSRWIRLYNRNVRLFYEEGYFGTELLYKVFKLS